MRPEIEPRHKKLTPFLCQELLYEYVSGTLDPSRAKDVDEYLPVCRDSQRELENLKRGLAYAQDVASIQVSASLRDALQAFEPGWKKRLRLWTLWSSQRGWRMLPYAFLAGAAGLGLYVTQPWQYEARRDFVIIEQARAPGAPKSAVALPPELEQATSLIAPSTPSLLVTNGVEAPPPPSTAVADEDKPQAGSGKGVLYNSEIIASDFDSAWPAVRDKIIGLEGKAAGSVELGWLRHPNESYFHFSLPESNLGEFQTFLKTFGPVRISKVRHPRVMPEGQIRIILTVKDGEKDEGEAEAP